MDLTSIPRPSYSTSLDGLGFSLGCGRTGLHICPMRADGSLGKLWPYMRGLIEDLRRKNPPRQKWMPEHVRMELAKTFAGQGQTECWLAHDEGKAADRIKGFLIVHPLFDPFVNLPLSLFVWLGCLEHDVLFTLLPEFEQMARERGFLSIEWMTGRKGWARRMSLVGYQPVEWRLAKEL